MGKFLFFVVASLACFIAVESLVCNQCSFSLFGFCVNKSNVTCQTNTSSCFTGQATFQALTSFKGFSSQGCRESSQCSNSNGTLLSVNYQTTISCCTTDNCNPVTISSDAPSTKMTFAAAAGVALLASVWGSFL